MAIGFFVMGLLSAARHREFGTATLTFWAIGGTLALAALTPGLGRAAYLAVYVPTSVIGFIISSIVVALMFFLVFLPLGLIVRLTGHDLLRLRRPVDRTLWIRRAAPRAPGSYYRQF
jgi:hypothetical protein